MPEGLQLILGADERNHFTVYKNSKDNKLHVYFGIGLYQVIKHDRSDPEFKLFLAKLYNSGVKVKNLIEHFGFSYPTYKRWGDALKSGDPRKVYDALSGTGGGKRKLTPEVVAFITHDFGHVYGRNQYSYSQEIRQDVKEVLGTELSAECVRGLLGTLKKTYLEQQGLGEREKKRIFKEYLK